MSLRCTVRYTLIAIISVSCGDVTEPIQEYRLLRVTYGVASASYLAVKSMQQSAAAANEEVVRLINSDFYMDDMLTGASTEDELLSLQRRVSQTLSNCGFDLRKWAKIAQHSLSIFQRRSHNRLIYWPQIRKYLHSALCGIQQATTFLSQLISNRYHLSSPNAHSCQTQANCLTHLVWLHPVRFALKYGCSSYGAQT